MKNLRKNVNLDSKISYKRFSNDYKVVPFQFYEDYIKLLFNPNYLEMNSRLHITFMLDVS